MRLKLIIISLVALMLSGCNVLQNESETIEIHGKTAWTFDGNLISAPTGYFLNGYEWVKVDEHTMQLVLTLTDNKWYGEM